MYIYMYIYVSTYPSPQGPPVMPHLSQFLQIIPDKKEIGLLKEKPNNHKTFKEPYIIKDL